MTLDPERLVAHRGWPARYPENTLAGFQAALEAGARNLEFDVQLTRDHVPMIMHEHTTKRTGTVDQDLFAMGAQEARSLCVGEPKRFDDRYADSTISSLADVVAMLDSFSGRVFVEIKHASILRFGNDRCIDAILPLTSKLGSRAVIISFDIDAISMAQKKGAERTGWVMSTFSEETLRNAADLRPDFLFVKRSRIEGLEFPASVDWRWVVYDVSTPQQAQELFGRGVDLVETDFIGEFLSPGDCDSD